MEYRSKVAGQVSTKTWMVHPRMHIRFQWVKLYWRIKYKNRGNMDTWIVEFLARPPQTEILVYLNNYNVYLNNCNDTLGRYKFGIFWEHGRLVRILPNRRLACFLK